MELFKNREEVEVPAILKFVADTKMAAGGKLALPTTQLTISLYKGGGQANALNLADLPPQIGKPLLTAMLVTKKFFDEDLEEPARFTHKCPGVLDRGEPCEGEAFEVTIDKRQDGLFILRLDCVKCGSTIKQDIRNVEKKKEN